MDESGISLKFQEDKVGFLTDLAKNSGSKELMAYIKAMESMNLLIEDREAE
jgi:hypothetical protein